MDETASCCSIETEDLKQSMRELKQKLINVCEASSTTSDILQKTVVVKSPTYGGKVIKRMLTCSPYEKRFKDRFNQSMEKNLPDNYVPPIQVNNIVEDLKERRFAIVSCITAASHIQPALFAIRKVGFDRSMCVEINDANDWIHIDPTETQLVLIRDPFGETGYDEKKTEHLMAHFDDILETTQSEPRFAVIFVSKMEIMSTAFRKCKAIGPLSDFFFSEMIIIKDDGNSESSPYGLEEGCRLARVRTQKSIEYDNIVRFSDELKRNALFYQFNKNDVKETRTVMKARKHVVIKGKVALATAVRLTADYEPDQSILLTNPDDIVHVPLDDVSLLVVLDFAGKYRYNEQKAQKWYERFDIIHAMVKRGRINVVLVSDQRKLQSCIKALGKHLLLQYEVNTTPMDFTPIKLEPNDLVDTSVTMCEQQTANRQMSSPCDTSVTMCERRTSTSPMSSMELSSISDAFIMMCEPQAPASQMSSEAFSSLPDTSLTICERQTANRQMSNVAFPSPADTSVTMYGQQTLARPMQSSSDFQYKETIDNNFLLELNPEVYLPELNKESTPPKKR